jgi:hypothetical protein
MIKEEGMALLSNAQGRNTRFAAEASVGRATPHGFVKK